MYNHKLRRISKRSAAGKTGGHSSSFRIIEKDIYEPRNYTDMTPEKLGASQFSSNDSAVALRGILDSTKKETLGDVIQTVKVSSDELT